jgi:hypothetical protein
MIWPRTAIPSILVDALQKTIVEIQSYKMAPCNTNPCTKKATRNYVYSSIYHLRENDYELALFWYQKLSILPGETWERRRDPIYRVLGWGLSEITRKDGNPYQKETLQRSHLVLLLSPAILATEGPIKRNAQPQFLKVERVKALYSWSYQRASQEAAVCQVITPSDVVPV